MQVGTLSVLSTTANFSRVDGTICMRISKDSELKKKKKKEEEEKKAPYSNLFSETQR